MYDMLQYLFTLTRGASQVKKYTCLTTRQEDCTKTFFMKVVYDEGQVLEKIIKIKDYVWLDCGETLRK